MKLTHPAFLDSFKIFINAPFGQGGKAIVDKVGNVLLQNSVGLQFPLIEGQNIVNVLSQVAVEQVKLDVSEILAEPLGRAFKIKIETGATYWYRMVTSPIRQGESPIFLIQFLDITEAKEIELRAIKQQGRVEYEMLLRTQEITQTNFSMENQGGYLQNFMRGLRHDLASPIKQLQEIIQYYQVTKDPGKKKRAAIYIQDCLQKLQNTAKGFSDFVDLHFLPESGWEVLTLDTIFEETKLLLRKEIGDAKAIITTDFDQAPSVRFKGRIMASIFYNLLSNAVKFRKENENVRIQIRSFLDENNFVLSVKDNGIGLDLEKYGHLLFVAFKRLTLDRPGAGIGLSMVKNILEQHGGVIEVESELGIGATVFVRIPILN